MHKITIVAAVAVAATLALAASAIGQAPRVFKIGIEATSLYRVSYEDLAAGGLAGPVALGSLGLSSHGERVPIWFEAGDDGLFGPGDSFEFVGERLKGEAGYFNEFSRFNVYWLDTAADTPLHGVDRQEPGVCSSDATAFVSRRHLEENPLRVRFSSGPSQRGEVWYWARLAHSDKERFEIEIPLDDIDLASSRPLELTLHFKGWSSVRSKKEDQTDHLVVIGLGGEELARRAWNNSAEGALVEGLDVDPSALAAAGGRLEVWVPRRPTGAGPIIDVVLLNWVEVEFPVRARAPSSFLPLWRPDGPPLGAECLQGGGDRPRILTASGERSLGGPAVLTGDLVENANGSTAYFAQGVAPDVSWIEADVPSSLAERSAQVDYLIISHPTLASAIEPLAAFHRERGLKVEVVEVVDVFDEYNHGIVHPRAIRDFLAAAYADRASPAPRFVLLVGDASWDLSNEPVDDANYANMSFDLARSYGLAPRRSPGGFKFSAKPQQVYAEGRPALWRNLIPTWDHRTSDGPAASDNWLADIVGGDLRPELAIGRFPVATAEEVKAIVEKTLRASSAGPTSSRRALFLTDQYQPSRSHAQDLAERLRRAGFETEEIYPGLDGTVGADHSGTVVDAFNAGPELVYFVGHGGRFEWRTGRPDLENQNDLFTLDHLDLLADAVGPLSIVTAMACYSAPFDHPSADSIGEKLLRLPSRGAAAVLAAAWRITPSLGTGRVLLGELAKGGTLGEALLRAKRSVGDFQFITQFNLLGDPALPIRAWSGPSLANGGVGE